MADASNYSPVGAGRLGEWPGWEHEGATRGNFISQAMQLYEVGTVVDCITYVTDARCRDIRARQITRSRTRGRRSAQMQLCEVRLVNVCEVQM